MENELSNLPRLVFLSSGGILGDLVLRKLQQSKKFQIVGVVRSRRMMRRDAGFLRGALVFFTHCGIVYSIYIWAITTAAEWLGWIFGRGSISVRAKKAGVPILHTRDINRREGRDFIQSLRPDIVVSAHFDQRLYPPLCDNFECSFVNIHPSPLPHYRGIEPVLHCMKNRDHQYGVTLHRIVESIDAGPILASRRIVPDCGKSVFRITYEMMGLGAELLISSAEHAISPGNGEPQISSGNYETWPTPLDLKELYKNGGRLINMRLG